MQLKFRTLASTCCQSFGSTYCQNTSSNPQSWSSMPTSHHKTCPHTHPFVSTWSIDWPAFRTILKSSNKSSWWLTDHTFDLPEKVFGPQIKLPGRHGRNSGVKTPVNKYGRWSVQQRQRCWHSKQNTMTSWLFSVHQSSHCSVSVAGVFCATLWQGTDYQKWIGENCQYKWIHY